MSVGGKSSAVKLRPDATIAMISALCFAVGCIFLFVPSALVSTPTPKSTDRAIGLSLAAAMMVFSGLGGLIYIKFRVIADESGVHSIKLNGAKFIAWADVTDYYEKTIRTKEGVKTQLIIEHGENKIIVLTGWTGDKAAFRAIVQAKALNARTKFWQLWGTRLEDNWPREFSYDKKENKTLRLILFGAPLLIFVVLLLGAFSKMSDDIHTIGWQWAAGRLLIVFFLPGLYALSLWAVLGGHQREAQRRRNERIIATSERIEFRCLKRTVLIPWSEVTSYQIEPGNDKSLIASPRRVIVSGNKERIEFSSAISEADILNAMVPIFASNARTKEWKFIGPDPDVLGREGSAWTGGVVGIGERVFHCRTRSNRSMLILAYVFTITLLIQPVLKYEDLIINHHDDIMFQFILTTLFVCASIYATIRYLMRRIVVDQDGLKLFDLGCRRFIRWKDIEDWTASGASIKVNAKSGASINFETSLLAYGSEIKPLIEQNLARVNAQTKESAP